ncbi:MAG: FAD-binding protein [bacterium]|jgi:fumarate reductase (CoM/CoB) subunit A|nr:FAD-binding protein [Betaproteobacteria bacterium]
MAMNEVERLSTDVLIIGGGVAGMMAAVAALRSGITPMLLTKGTYASGSSSMARGGHSVAIGHSSADDNPELFFEDTITGGFGLNNRRLAMLMCTESIDRTLELDAWGLGLARLADGTYDQKMGAFPHRHARLVHCGRLMGKPLMNALSRKTKGAGVAPMDHVMLVDLLRHEDRVVGAWGFRYREGTPVVVHARATVLTTGGAPQLHALNDSPPTITGDGYAMAWRAGAELIDMEFIDYQMITAAPAKLAGYPPHSSGFLNEGGYLLNRDGERFMARYDPERMERSTRSMLNRAVAMELFEGRGTEHNAVRIDIRHVFEHANSGASADIIKTFRNGGVDLSRDFLEVTSCPHTYLGGVRIDEWGRSTVPGLYVGGEAAGGIHGANRLGGAALIDSYVFGFRAGMAAALECKATPSVADDRGDWQSGVAALASWSERSGGDSPEEWRNAVQALVVESVGLVRRADRLQHALARLDALEARFADVGVRGETARDRFDCLRLSLETRNLVQVARMLATAALQREESRGGHCRLDFPERDDARFLGNFVLWNEGGSVKHALRPVPGLDAAEPPPGAVTAALAA